MLDQLKIGNLTNILTCLFSEKRLTKAQLVRLTGLSNSTVSSAVNSLLKLKLLVGDGYGESIGGRLLCRRNRLRKHRFNAIF